MARPSTRGGRGESRDRALRVARTAGQELFPGGGVREGLRIAARLPQTWVLAVLYFTSFGGFLALTAWLPTYWSERFGLSLSAAGALTMAYSVLASVIRVPGGFLADRLEGGRTAVASFGVMAVGALVVSFGGSVGGAVGGALAMAAGMGVANAAVFKMVPSYLAVGGGGAYGWAFGIFVLLAMGLTVRVVAVRCPAHGEKTEVWAQAFGGEMASVRLLRCSLLPGEVGELSCPKTCMQGVKAQMEPGGQETRS